MKNSLFAAALALTLAACTTMPGSKPNSRPAATPTMPDSATAKAGANPGALIAAAATAMLGQPYRYGGVAPGGFDCSGLVVYAAASVGLHMPRTAQEQLNTGTSIARTDLRAGDLVFMHLARKELHVGIAIDNDRFVHAPSARGHVRIDSLSRPPYAHGFLKARRIVNAGLSPRP